MLARRHFTTGMRGLLPVAIVLLSLVPLAGATPIDCTGQGIPTDFDVVRLRCERYDRPQGPEYVKTLEVRLDLEVVALAVGFQQDHQTGENGSAYCRVFYHGSLAPYDLSRTNGCVGVHTAYLP